MTSTDNAASTDPRLPEGTRPTRQRRAVAAVMQSFDDFRTLRRWRATFTDPTMSCIDNRFQ